MTRFAYWLFPTAPAAFQAPSGTSPAFHADGAKSRAAHNPAVLLFAMLTMVHFTAAFISVTEVPRASVARQILSTEYISAPGGCFGADPAIAILLVCVHEPEAIYAKGHPTLQKLLVLSYKVDE